MSSTTSRATRWSSRPSATVRNSRCSTPQPSDHLEDIVSSNPNEFALIQPYLLNTPEHVNNAGLSRTAIFNAVEGSLKRLNTSYIDLLQIHRFDPVVPVEETMRALHDLVVSGKVRYIGASSMRCWEFARMNEVAEKNGWTKFVSMQDQYSLLYREEVSWKGE